MEWTKTQKAVVAIVVALPFIVTAWLMMAVLKGPSPKGPNGEPVADQANFKPVPQSGKAKVTNSVPLDAFYYERSSSFTMGNGSGWPGLPRDVKVFSNVRFQVDGSIILGGGPGYVAGYNYPENELGIPVKGKFASLYVLHFTEWSDPRGTPVYDLVLRYQDGSSVTNELKYGTDLMDFYAPNNDRTEPSGPNSVVAWRGHFVMGNGTDQALRLFLTELKNPRPSDEVASVDLYSRKNQSAGCVLSITTGESGLVHKAKPAQ